MSVGQVLCLLYASVGNRRMVFAEARCSGLCGMALRDKARKNSLPFSTSRLSY